MKTTFSFLAILVLVSVSTKSASAQFGCPGPFCNYPHAWLGSQNRLNNGGYSNGNQNRYFSFLQPNRGPAVPVFMAAPWYLYWPYDAHFMTSAPPSMMGGYNPPPVYTGMPYFANPNAAYSPGSSLNSYPMSMTPPTQQAAPTSPPATNEPPAQPNPLPNLNKPAK